MLPPAKPIGSVVILVWSAARIISWLSSRRRTIVESRTGPLRRSLLVLVSATLVPIYLYYFTPVLDRWSLAWPAWLSWLGVVILALSVGLFIWSHAALGANWSVSVAVSSEQTLVTRGPYRFVRHPMYAALFLMAFGLLAATGNLIVGVPFGIAMMATYLERVDDEEQMMVETFGDAYRSYMRDTGRVLPRLRRRRGDA